MLAMDTQSLCFGGPGEWRSWVRWIGVLCIYSPEFYQRFVPIPSSAGTRSSGAQGRRCRTGLRLVLGAGAHSAHVEGSNYL